MQYWIIDDDARDLVRILWNGASLFNLQSHISGEWVDFHCFTCYGIDTEQKALEHAQKILNEQDTLLWRMDAWIEEINSW